MNSLPVNFLAFGYSIGIAYAAAILLLPVLAAIYSLIDFKRIDRYSKDIDKKTRCKGFLILFFNNEFVVIWCIFTGLGLLIVGGVTLFAEAPLLERIGEGLVLVIPGILLELYAAKKTAGRF